MSAARILIVEDESIIAMDLSLSLAAMGYEIAGCAVNGEHALDMVRESSPNLILMDINLRSGIDGIDTALRIRRIVNVPVIFLTAYANDEILERVKRSEAAGYLIKPVRERELQMTIEMALNKDLMQRKLKENERRLEATLRSIADGVITTAKDGGHQV